LLFVLLRSVAAPLFSPYDPNPDRHSTAAAGPLLAPYSFGTDAVWPGPADPCFVRRAPCAR
jgi:hypothetical protein